MSRHPWRPFSLCSHGLQRHWHWRASQEPIQPPRGVQQLVYLVNQVYRYSEVKAWRRAGSAQAQFLSYLRVERWDDSHTRHKLFAVAEGLYLVDITRGNTGAVCRDDDTIENVIRDRVLLAPKVQTVEEFTARARLMTDGDLFHQSYPVPEGENFGDLPLSPPVPKAQASHALEAQPLIDTARQRTTEPTSTTEAAS